MTQQSKKVDWGAVYALATSGIPLREIAHRLNINPNTVFEQNQNPAVRDELFALEPYQIEFWAEHEHEGRSFQQIKRYFDALSPQEKARLEGDWKAQHAKRVRDIDS